MRRPKIRVPAAALLLAACMAAMPAAATRAGAQPLGAPPAYAPGPALRGLPAAVDAAGPADAEPAMQDPGVADPGEFALPEPPRGGERTIVSGGRKREYILHLPAGGGPGGNAYGPWPLVIALHGALQPASVLKSYLDLDAVADREGFAVAYPRGMNLLWNDGRSSVAGFIPMLHKRDDGRFVLDVLDELVGQGIADPGRAYLMGFSNGGFLTAFVACRYGERFAAYATMMMTAPVGYAESCRPSRPVPILLMNGTYDPIVPMFGRPTPGARLMSAGETAALFARIDGCAEPERGQLPGARITRWNSCADGAAVAFYEIEGGHQPPSSSSGAGDVLASLLLGPRSRGFDAPEEIWGFFRRFGTWLPPATAGASAAAPARMAGGVAPRGTVPLPPPSPLRQRAVPAP